MKSPLVKPVRCAIYTRVSTDHGLDQEFNSLDAQYDAASAYIKSQAHAGWSLIRSRYDDGGYSGGSTDRPDLQRLLDDIRSRKIDVIVVYKVDRLTRSLADFAKLVELFDTHGVSFVSVIPAETACFQSTTVSAVREDWMVETEGTELPTPHAVIIEPVSDIRVRNGNFRCRMSTRCSPLSAYGSTEIS
jgi:hypothetical protein